MEPISFSFNDFDFVVNPFDFASMNGVVAMIDDAVTVAIKHLGKTGQ